MDNINVMQKFYTAPIGSLVFCWGLGFISEGIRYFQKFESLETQKRLAIKRDIDYDKTAPTHVETKINFSEDVSAEFSGVEVVKFERLLEKNIGLVLAEPIIETQEEMEWQLAVVDYLMEYVKRDAPYDIVGFLAFIYRALDLILPMANLTKCDFGFAGFCSEIASEVFYMKGGEGFLELEEEPSMISPLELLYKVNQSKRMRVSILNNPDNIVNLIYKPENSGMVSAVPVTI